jgi:hypothetical protein
MYYGEHILIVQDYCVYHGHSSLTQFNFHDLSLLRPLVIDAEVRDSPEETWNSNIIGLGYSGRKRKKGTETIVPRNTEAVRLETPCIRASWLGLEMVGTCFRSVAPSSHLQFDVHLTSPVELIVLSHECSRVKQRHVRLHTINSWESETFIGTDGQKMLTYFTRFAHGHICCISCIIQRTIRSS